MEDFSILEVPTVLNPPIILNFIDYINCSVCDFEIDVKDKEVDDKSIVFCENCKHAIKLKIVQI